MRKFPRGVVALLVGCVLIGVSLGCSVVMAAPAEAVFDGTDVRVEVLYDDDERVDFVCVYSGHSAVTSGPLINPSEMRERTRSDSAHPEEEPVSEPK